MATATNAACTASPSTKLKACLSGRPSCFPILKTDQEAEDFVATADLSGYGLSEMVPYRFEFTPKDERVNMRLPKSLPKSLLDAVKALAEKAKMPYQRYIRAVLESAVSCG